ncbi:hypothetical protein STVA_06110 [Allostella vacuolata]|nr:hypothetical protein STVA_06110 [Stella vacuolata]
MAEEGRLAVLRRLDEAGAKGIGERIAALRRISAGLWARPAWDAVSRAGAQEAGALAHKLAGSGGTFGFPHVSRVAASLETVLAELAQGADPPADVEKQVERLLAALQSAFARGPAGSRFALAQAEVQAAQGQEICVVAPADRLRGLVELVAGLGFMPIPCDLADPAALPDQAAAVVVLAPDGTADLVRLDPVLGRGPTILVADRVDLDVRLAAARSGIDAVMPLPIDTAELADWLNSFVGSGSEVPYSVLIVDDDQLLVEVYAAALEQAGMVVSVTTNPAEAPALIGAHFPDLVLMDVQMPGISGIELAQVIRQSRRFLSLPVVFLSAERDSERQFLARRFGGDDFITKPVDLERLVTMVRLRAERARSLRSAMEHDSLTGLLNHGRFKDKLQHELERCRRNGGEISLAILDLDLFKAVNDTYGHLAGDQVIRGLARTLRARLRRIDLAGRYGGEEFAVILLDTPPGAAFGVVDQTRRVFAQQRFESEGQAFQATFSAGIASSRRHPEINQLIAAADAMLYEAKRAGRDAVFVDGGPGG